MALQCTIVCIWLFRDTVPPSVVSLSLSLSLSIPSLLYFPSVSSSSSASSPLYICQLFFPAFDSTNTNWMYLLLGLTSVISFY